MPNGPRPILPISEIPRPLAYQDDLRAATRADLALVLETVVGKLNTVLEELALLRQAVNQTNQFNDLQQS